MDEVQAEINEMEATATSGGGAVTVTVSGAKEIKDIQIKPEVVDPDDVEMLEDLVLTAANEALRQMEEISQNAMKQIHSRTGNTGILNDHEILCETSEQANKRAVKAAGDRRQDSSATCVPTSFPWMTGMPLRCPMQYVPQNHHLRYCSVCGNLTDEDPCAICSDESRDISTICVVESSKARHSDGEDTGIQRVLPCASRRYIAYGRHRTGGHKSQKSDRTTSR